MKTNTDLRHIFPELVGILTDGNGQTYNLSWDDIPSGSFSLKSGTSTAGTFDIGGAIISSCNFALHNEAGTFNSVAWTNSKVDIHMNAGGESVFMGQYYIVSHSESSGVITITAFDALKIFDSYDLHELSLSYPTTIGAIAQSIASSQGMTVSGIRTPDISVNEALSETMTQRACLAYIAQVCGQYIRITNSNTISFEWYDFGTIYDDYNTFSHDWRTSDTTITGVRVIADEKTEDRGTDGYRIEISGNPIITDDNVASIVDTIASACVGLSFRAGSAEIVASPAFDAGDVISVNSLDENNVKLVLTNITYTPDVCMSVTSDADVAEGDLVLNKTPYLSRNELDDPNSALSKAISAAGGGTKQGQWIRIALGNAYVVSNTYAERLSFTNGVSRVLLPTTAHWNANGNNNNLVWIPSYKASDIQLPFNIHLGLSLDGATVNYINYGGWGYVDILARYIRQDVIQLNFNKGFDNIRTDVFFRSEKVQSIDYVQFLPMAASGMSYSFTPEYLIYDPDQDIWRLSTGYA